MNCCFSILLAALLPGTLLFSAEDETPVELKPYVKLAEQCEQHDPFVAATTGSLVEEFATATNQTWKALPTQFAAPTLELRKVDDRTVLAITSLNDVTVEPNLDAPALIAVGPPIVGSVRLEMVAYSNTDKPCDLSLLLGPVAESPGFQFGGYRNTRNILWADTGETNSWQAVRLPPAPLITPRQWHTVRLDIADRELIASVDGKILGRTTLSDQFDLKAPLQPTIYCYDSSILVDRFTITRAASGTPSDLKALAWKRTFGALTQADMDKKITELVVLLDHENSKVRDGAQTLLTKAGLFAQPALRQTIKTGTIEQRLRAREILGERELPSQPPTDF